VSSDAKADLDRVEAARSGSTEAKEELVRRHWRAVWQRGYMITGRAHVADDVTQDAFERALRALHRYDGRAPFGAWIGRIATNRALDVLRGERRLFPLDDAVEAWADAPGSDPTLVRAVGRLAPERRAVVVLRYWLDLTGPEIADALDIAVGTVHSRLSRALDDLREALGETDS
jgi:RNA polymerase sigma-70 factor (ECF subfamily)